MFCHTIITTSNKSNPPKKNPHTHTAPTHTRAHEHAHVYNGHYLVLTWTEAADMWAVPVVNVPFETGQHIGYDTVDTVLYITTI